MKTSAGDGNGAGQNEAASGNGGWLADLSDSQKLEKTIDTKVLELEFRLRKSEADLLIASEKIAIYEDKIKDKNEIIEIIKISNNLFKSDYKEKVDTQAMKIRKLEEELSTTKKINLKLDQEIEKLKKEPKESKPNKKLRQTIFFFKEAEKENKKIISSLRTQISDQTSPKNAIKTNELEASLRNQIKQKNETQEKHKNLIASLKDKINQQNIAENESKYLIASLKDQLSKKNEEENADLIDSLMSQLEEKDAKVSEKEEVITSLMSQIKLRDENITFIEARLQWEMFKNKEKDDHQESPKNVNVDSDANGKWSFLPLFRKFK
ncbi:uncharacterized protein PFB0765w [Drosophila subpulchrella]|uniref:uncharacterized protein PFB0765w n=1 Tax=Drosophila subpulchrella TaxID=1486046 RepID=UPI0018A17579|nr:uncharacterized protein PFB0765w [Drosophila subpulchrella]